MAFLDLARERYSCRSYQKDKAVEQEKLDRILEAARLSPSACNGQPYHLTVCQGELAKRVAKETQSMGMNRFASDAPVMLVVSEMPYVKSAGVGAKLKHNDYRSMDIGILAAYVTAAAHDEGLGSCMLGWFEEEKIRRLCQTSGIVRLVIALGYNADPREQKPKKRKSMDELVTVME